MADEPAAAVVVLTALDLEYQAVRAHLVDVRACRHAAGTRFELGHLTGSDGKIAIGLTGEGNTGSAILAERAITVFRPRALLFVGVAGALHNDVQLGDVVVATKVYGYHSGKDECGGFLARPQTWRAPHELEQLARHLGRTQTWQRQSEQDPVEHRPRVHFGPVAAGEVILDSRDSPLRHQLRRTCNDAIAVETESAGVAHAGQLNHSLASVIRGDR